MARKFKKENCSSLLRESVVNKFNERITLWGRHAFEWGVNIESPKEPFIHSYEFKDRKSAKSFFNLLIKKK